MKVYRYVMKYDGGSAPNYDGPATTLAICKPAIRRAAQPGDLVLAFTGARLDAANPHGVRWAGIVAETLDFASYWNDPRFRAKRPGRTAVPDNIYQPVDGDLRQVCNPVHGPDNAARDLRGERVLIFGRTWRFGDAAPVLPEEFGLRIGLAGRIGHRVDSIDGAGANQLIAWLDGREPASGGEEPMTLPAQMVRTPLRRTRRASGCG